MHDAPTFKNWEGVNAARQRLVEAFGQMVEGELEEKDGQSTLRCQTLLVMLMRTSPLIGQRASTSRQAGLSPCSTRRWRTKSRRPGTARATTRP